MIGLHFRAAEDPGRAERVLDALASELAEKYDLRRARGRMAFELRPPMRFSKGDVVEALAQELGLRAILFAGDDRVDLPGFDALDALATAGVMGVRVAVLSAEAPADLLRRADITVEGPEGMVALLQRLV
jgi:trehalose 6-phosphate phosphatase